MRLFGGFGHVFNCPSSRSRYVATGATNRIVIDAAPASYLITVALASMPDWDRRSCAWWAGAVRPFRGLENAQVLRAARQRERSRRGMVPGTQRTGSRLHRM